VREPKAGRIWSVTTNTWRRPN